MAGASDAQILGLGNCDPRLDNDGPFITRAHDSCCSTTSCQSAPGNPPYVRWLRQDVAEAEGFIVTIGDDEIDMNLVSSPVIASQTSTCFGKHFSATNVLSTANLRAYVEDVRDRVPAGKQGPLIFWLQRWDLLTRQELALNQDPYKPLPSWVLRTDRAWATFTDFFDRSPVDPADQATCGTDGEGCDWSRCRTPSTPFSDADSWDAGAGSGCNSSESGKRLYELLNTLSNGLAEGSAGSDGRPAVYYVGGGPKMFSAVGVLADMLEPTYQDAMVELAARAFTELGVDGVDFPHKNGFFWQNSSPRNYCLDVGDALSCGFPAAECTQLDPNGTVNSLHELEDCGAFSGPPERASGAAWGWAARAQAEVEIARKLYSRTAGRVPYFRYVNPYWYSKCFDSGWTIDSDFGDAACAATGGADGKFDDPASSGNEAVYQREIVQRAAYVLIELGGKPRTDPSIGSGAGSGYSFEQLKAKIENPAPGVPAPKVVGWYQSAPAGTTGKLCRNPGETNPEAFIQ